MKSFEPMWFWFALLLQPSFSVSSLRQRDVQILPAAVVFPSHHLGRNNTNNSNARALIISDRVTAKRAAGDIEFIMEQVYGKQYHEPRSAAYDLSEEEKNEWARTHGYDSLRQGATYGEVTPVGIQKLIEAPEVNAKPNEKFYDLGSGDGKVVMVAWLMGFPATGIELVEKRFDESCRALRDVEKLQRQAGWESSSVMHFYRASFTEFSFADADILYMANWCFPDGVKQKIATAARQLKKGSRIIAFKPLETSDFVTLGTIAVPVSWDNNLYKMIVQKKVTEPAVASNPPRALTEVPAKDHCEL